MQMPQRKQAAEPGCYAALHIRLFAPVCGQKLNLAKCTKFYDYLKFIDFSTDHYTEKHCLFVYVLYCRRKIIAIYGILSTVFLSDCEVDVSKTLPCKKLLTSFVIICYVVLIVASGCTFHQKKRGIVFRGDWAFEVNRTPWVGHPGNTDIPGMEEEKKSKSDCINEKSSLSDSLLGPLASLKGKCRCKNCAPAGGNINITSYNPTVANTFPSPVTGAYPGTPPGALTLPPGAIVVPTGVLMPNGMILPHHLFITQPGAATYNGINPAVGQPVQNVQPENSTSLAVVPGQILQPSTENTQNSENTPTNQTLQQPQLAAPGTTTSYMTPAVSPEVQAMAAQQATLQGLNTSNPMLINPAPGQVVAGLSMTGTQAPGYPPIGYAVAGYSPGYAQQVYPPLSGPLAAGMSQQQIQQQALAAGRPQTENPPEELEEPSSQRHVAVMPYPRHHPMPTRPVYQRNMGMAPGYAMVQSPMQARPNMYGSAQSATVLQSQINQTAAMQERQMMLERQRQALIMQQNMAVQQSNVRRNNNTVAAKQPAIADEYAAEEIAPPPPGSKILLANHQTPILQSPQKRSSQAPPMPTTSGKKSR